MRPDGDWRWLASTVDRLRRRCRYGELKPRAGVSASEIYEWAHRRMAACDRPGPGSAKRRAVLFREGLTLGLLIARPLRLRTFLSIEIGRHIVEAHEGFTLRFEPGDMKDRKARSYALPRDLVESMRCYLRVHRPVLLAGKTSSRLWITKDARPLSVPGFVGRLAKITRREFGEALRPHAFRHVVATSIAVEDPEHANVIASVLGHATLEMAGRHYNRARRVEALSAYQEMVRAMRREGNDRGPGGASRRGRRPVHASADAAERRRG